MCPVFPPRSRNDDYDDDDDSTRVLRFLWLICGFHLMAYKPQPAGKWVYLATKYCWFLDGTGMVNDKLGAWPRCGSFA